MIISTACVQCSIWDGGCELIEADDCGGKPLECKEALDPHCLLFLIGRALRGVDASRRIDAIFQPSLGDRVAWKPFASGKPAQILRRQSRLFIPNALSSVRLDYQAKSAWGDEPGSLCTEYCGSYAAA